jgi:hypothetical protein
VFDKRPDGLILLDHIDGDHVEHLNRLRDLLVDGVEVGNPDGEEEQHQHEHEDEEDHNLDVDGLLDTRKDHVQFVLDEVAHRFVVVPEEGVFLSIPISTIPMSVNLGLCRSSEKWVLFSMKAMIFSP